MNIEEEICSTAEPQLQTTIDTLFTVNSNHKRLLSRLENITYRLDPTTSLSTDSKDEKAIIAEGHLNKLQLLISENTHLNDIFENFLVELEKRI